MADCGGKGVSQAACPWGASAILDGNRSTGAKPSLRAERVGTLAHQLSARFPSKKPEFSLKMAVEGASSTDAGGRGS
jgi:hypothetical protein